MFTFLAWLVVYGIGAGCTVAAIQATVDYPDGMEFVAAILWPISLPAVIAWWAVKTWMGDSNE